MEMQQAIRRSTFVHGMIAGMVGGLAGTVSMYLFGAGIFALLGWPTNTSFMIIGDSAAAFFSNLGIALAGGASLGMLLFFLIGLVLGAILGVAMVFLKPLYLASFRKKVGLSVLYVEAMSLPLLSAGTLALKMNDADAVLWFGISFVMHLVYGLVLGLVAGYEIGDQDGGSMADKNKRWGDIERNRTDPDTYSSLSKGKFFEIHVKGQLDSRWSEWFEGLEMKLLDNGEMLLFGPISDQAALMGVLTKLSRLNLALRSVNEVKKKD